MKDIIAIMFKIIIKQNAYLLFSCLHPNLINLI